MKIKRYLNLLAVMSVFAACQNETDILDAPLKGTEVTIEAAREGVAGSRTTLTEENKLNWHESDKLSVFLGSGVNQPFTIHEGAGTDYATFKGTGDIFITGGSESSAGAFANVAYYPYSEGVQVSQGANGAYTITASLPSNQTFRQGSFGQDAYHMVAVAESNRDYAFTFKNVGSMLMLYLKGSAEITKIELSSQANKLAGACTVTAAYGEEPSIALDVNSAESKITLNCMSEVAEGVTKGVQLSETESTVFVIAVPPIAGVAEDLTFTIYDANYGYMEYKNVEAYSVERNQYYTFGATSAVEYQATAYTEDYVQDADGNVVIYTADGLVNAATNLFPNGGTFKIAADIDMTNMKYPSVDFNKDVDFIIDGGNHAITGMTMPLINSTWSAGELVKVMNLTLKDPAIAIDVEDAEENVRVGAFIAGPGASDNVVLDNCHIDGGYVKGGHWTGGLVGAADGYNGSDGPVFETLTITKCSVKNCTIESKGSVGGIIGHGAFSAWTLVDMDDITVSGNTIKSTGSSDNKAGSVMGTIGAAQTATVAGGTESKDGYISVDNATIENNTVTSNGTTIDRIYGRQGSPGGTLYIDGVQVVFDIAQLKAALLKNMSEFKVLLADGTYQMPAEAKGKTLTISGTNAAVIEVVSGGQGEANGQLDYSLDGSTVTFNGVTIKTNSQLYAGYARLSAVYNDCVIQNTYNLGTGTSEFNRCTFNITNEYLRVGGANSATFDSCTFNTDGRAILVFQDGTSVAQTVTVKDCTFNATAAANTWNGIHVAAVSIDGTNGTYTVNLKGNNTVDSDFNGLWQIKAGEANVTVNE